MGENFRMNKRQLKQTSLFDPKKKSLTEKSRLHYFLFIFLLKPNKRKSFSCFLSFHFLSTAKQDKIIRFLYNFTLKHFLFFFTGSQRNLRVSGKSNKTVHVARRLIIEPIYIFFKSMPKFGKRTVLRNFGQPFQNYHWTCYKEGSKQLELR